MQVRPELRAALPKPKQTTPLVSAARVPPPSPPAATTSKSRALFRMFSSVQGAMGGGGAECVPAPKGGGAAERVPAPEQRSGEAAAEVRLRPAVPADLPALARLYSEAFEASPPYRWIFSGDATQPAPEGALHWLFRRRAQMMLGRGCALLVGCGPGGEVVAAGGLVPFDRKPGHIDYLTNGERKAVGGVPAGLLQARPAVDKAAPRCRSICCALPRESCCLVPRPGPFWRQASCCGRSGTAWPACGARCPWTAAWPGSRGTPCWGVWPGSWCWWRCGQTCR